MRFTRAKSNLLPSLYGRDRSQWNGARLWGFKRALRPHRDAELESLEAEANSSIDLREFIPIEKVDPIYFESSYYLAPDKGADKPYRLLADTMLKLCCGDKFSQPDPQAYYSAAIEKPHWTFFSSPPTLFDDPKVRKFTTDSLTAFRLSSWLPCKCRAMKRLDLIRESDPSSRRPEPYHHVNALPSEKCAHTDRAISSERDLGEIEVNAREVENSRTEILLVGFSHTMNQVKVSTVRGRDQFGRPVRSASSCEVELTFDSMKLVFWHTKPS
jgi:Ku70/Ku80 beta-barrel domain